MVRGMRGMQMRESVGMILIGLVWLASPSHASVNWAQLLDQGDGAKVRFGVLIDGRAPFARNADEAFAPASVSKVFTAGAALHRLGADYRFATKLSWEQDGARASRVVLTGGGDPTWGLPQLGENIRTRVDHYARQLKAAGVAEIAGEPETRVSDPRWNEPTIPAGWKSHDTLSCGGSLALGFNIALNCATYKVTGAGTGAWQSPGLTWPVEHRLAEGEKTAVYISLTRVAGKLKYVLTGTFKKGDPARSFTVPVFETQGWARALFRQALLDQGIRILPAGSFGGDPRGQPKELSFVSPPLSEILKPFLKNSVNFLGDSLLRALAAEGRVAGAGLLEPALASLRDFLTGLGLPRDFTLHDGSGLSRTSRTSPRFVLEFLARAQREPWFPVFRDALAVAGVDGTLRNRMKGTAAQGKLRAKTGTLEGVYNLAGYVPAGKEHVPFAILTATTAGLQNAARASEDRVGATLAGLYPNLFVSEEAAPQPYPYVPEQAGYDDQ